MRLDAALAFHAKTAVSGEVVLRAFRQAKEKRRQAVALQRLAPRPCALSAHQFGLTFNQTRAKQTAMAAATAAETEIPKRSEFPLRQNAESSDGVKELERQNRDLEINTRAKDYILERLEKERGQFVEKLVGMSRYVGELETQLLQLGGAPRSDRSLPKSSEDFGNAKYYPQPRPDAERMP